MFTCIHIIWLRRRGIENYCCTIARGKVPELLDKYVWYSGEDGCLYRIKYTIREETKMFVFWTNLFSHSDRNKYRTNIFLCLWFDAYAVCFGMYWMRFIYFVLIALDQKTGGQASYFVLMMIKWKTALTSHQHHCARNVRMRF